MTDSKPVDSPPCLKLVNSQFLTTSLASEKDGNNNSLNKSTNSEFGGENENGIASEDNRSLKAFHTPDTWIAPGTLPDQKERDKPSSTADSTPLESFGPATVTPSLKSKDIGSSSSSLPSGHYDHELGMKNSEKNVQEIQLNQLEGKVQDGGFSAWLIVLSAFWIFFIMVIRIYPN